MADPKIQKLMALQSIAEGVGDAIFEAGLARDGASTKSRFTEGTIPQQAHLQDWH